MNCHGDFNGDGFVNSLDVPLLIQALTNRAAYDAAFPNVNADIVGDVDASGTFDLGDVGAFSGLLGGPAAAEAVPEPGSAILFSIALAGLALVGYRGNERR